mgnify:CR=1 FL=1|jgi:hypothetical protein
MTSTSKPGALASAAQIIDEFLQCDRIGRDPGKLRAQARDWLAAHGPGSIPDTESREDPQLRTIVAGTVTRVGDFEVEEHRVELDSDFEEAMNQMPEGTTVWLYAVPKADQSVQEDPSAAKALETFPIPRPIEQQVELSIKAAWRCAAIGVVQIVRNRIKRAPGPKPQLAERLISDIEALVAEKTTPTAQELERVRAEMRRLAGAGDAI